MLGEWLVAGMLMAAGAPQQQPAARKHVALSARDVSASASFSVIASPATISFSAVDPDTPFDAGSSASTVTWNASGLSSKAWSLKLSAAASTFSNCSTVPVSAVTVTCASAAVGGGGAGKCQSSFPLSTAQTLVVTGKEGAGLSNYAVTLTFTLADSWKYIATSKNACTLTITYNAVLN